MQTQGFRWDDLRVLLALFREGSLRAAGDSLGVNISTVSRRLDALEEAVGQHLFDRTPDGTRPTESAEKLLPFAESMEHASVQLANAVDGFESEPSGPVRISAPPGIVDYFVAEILGELAQRYPKLQVEIDSSIGYSDLTRREADIALRIIRPASGDLIATRIGTASFHLVAANRLVNSIGKLRRLDDTSWVTYDRSLGHLPEASWIATQVDEENIAVRSNSFTAQVEAVRAGAGATLLPAPFRGLRGIAELPMTPALRRRAAALPERSLWLVGHRALRHVPRVAVAWDYLIDRLRRGFAV